MAVNFGLKLPDISRCQEIYPSTKSDIGMKFNMLSPDGSPYKSILLDILKIQDDCHFSRWLLKSALDTILIHITG